MAKKAKEKETIQIEDLNSQIERFIYERLSDELIPLALEVFKAEMYQSESKDLRHKAALSIMDLLHSLNNPNNNPTEKQNPLINLNFPAGYLEKTFNGMSEVLSSNKGVKHASSIKELAEEDYL